ncbi:MAG: hypothetical protein WAK02_07895, partial [Terriglobales bacterium]
NPVWLVVKSCDDFLGSLVPVEPGQDLADYEWAVSADDSPHALQHVRLEILDVDFDHIHVHWVTRFVLVESHRFNVHARRALPGLPTVAD